MAEKLKITFTGFIVLKPNSKNRIAETASLGQNELWCSANLYRQLHLLENLFPRKVCDELSAVLVVLLLIYTDQSKHSSMD